VNRLVAMSWDGNSQFPRSSRIDSQLQYFSFGINEYSTPTDEGDLSALDASETQTSMLIQLMREDEHGGARSLQAASQHPKAGIGHRYVMCLP